MDPYAQHPQPASDRVGSYQRQWQAVDPQGSGALDPLLDVISKLNGRVGNLELVNAGLVTEMRHVRGSPAEAIRASGDLLRGPAGNKLLVAGLVLLGVFGVVWLVGQRYRSPKG